MTPAYEGGWPVLSLPVSSVHRKCAVGVFVIAELATKCTWSRNLKPNFSTEPRTSRFAIQYAYHWTTNHHAPWNSL